MQSSDRKQHCFVGGPSRPELTLLGYIRRMAPTILRQGPFRLFFFSREESRIHVHVAHPDGEAKFWLTPAVAVATSVGLSERQLREASTVIEEHLEEIRHAWTRHFGS
jgi:hypothetical protein